VCQSDSEHVPRPHPPETAKALLAELIQQACDAALTPAWSPPLALRVEVPIHSVGPLAWLRAQPAGRKTYWSGRENEFAMAGLGAADVLMADDAADSPQMLRKMRGVLSPANPGMRYYGGVGFRPASCETPSWRVFGACQFIVPRFELCVRGGRHFLACNIVLWDSEPEAPPCDDILTELDGVCFPGDDGEPAVPAPLARQDNPDQEGWVVKVKQALAAISRGGAEKVVLARESRFSFPSAFDPLALLARLTQEPDRSYHFCFQPSLSAAFIGASPFRLYLRINRYIQTEAVAGTRGRGRSAETDKELSDQLMQSRKDLHDHRVVVSAVRDMLIALCRAVYVDASLNVLRLRHCQHLYCRIQGLLAHTDSDAALLEALHPTPVTCGHPVEDAGRLIEDIEPFKRGWYGSPVGWIGYDGAEFAVATRAALADGESLSLYSAAGLVYGANPQREWDRAEDTIQVFLRALSPTG